MQNSFNQFAAIFVSLFTLGVFAHSADAETSLTPQRLRCEYRENPLGIDEAKPRLNWLVVSPERGQKQTAYRMLVASSTESLANHTGDLWDSGKIDSSQTIQVEYGGKLLTSTQQCFWKVKVWDRDGVESDWSESALWTMGLLSESDWSGDYISFKDNSPIYTDRKSLYLPPARQYRKPFQTNQPIKRATIYSTALGIYELELNGQRVSDNLFAPGWTDYRQRAYYNTYDVTELVRSGDNAFGATVADGWYSGYVGFGLLVGIGTEQTGRCTYGKTPALMAQLEIEYADGSKQKIVTDKSWKVTGAGPIRQADLLMGEFYDARQQLNGWSSPGFDDSRWDAAILASENGPQPSNFYEFRNPTNGGGPKITPQPIDLAFKRPKLESFPGEPVRKTEELKPISVTKRDDGRFIFDLGQNFAGNIRLDIIGSAGHEIKLRYGEMLHTDGSLMTENLREARATDYYICSGDAGGEVFEPRFTFHGFQFVEVSNYPGTPTVDSLTGLVLHSDTPMTSTFECSDPMVNRLFKNVVWTQRANFIDLPTDCPQRDERMGWTGDAQAYVGTAAYNADVGAFFTKWNRELMESQRPSGAFPGYAPYPFQHGWDFGSAWADAGIICPWTIWQAYGDTRMIDRCWEPMTRFMQWRKQTSVGELGIAHGNAWGDWLNQNETTPLDYVDSVYFAISTKMMAEMAEATGRDAEAQDYRAQFERTKVAFNTKYVASDGSIRVPTQSAQALALLADLVPTEMRPATAKKLANMIAANGNHMATGFLGTRPLLPVLSSAGQHDLATFLLQSHEFPSWGYEIDQGATTIWERWDSFTKEDGFGRHNAAMNSFSHYSFGAVCEWMFRTLAGIDSDSPGYQTIVINPHPPTPGSNAQHQPIDWVRASYDSIRGKIISDWKVDGEYFQLNVTIPANTTAKIYLPATDATSITESGHPITGSPHMKLLGQEDDRVVVQVDSGQYRFSSKHSIATAAMALKTSVPPDRSFNPGNIDLSSAEKLMTWDFRKPADVAKWNMANNIKIEQRDGKAFLIGTGNDPQLTTRLAESVPGMLAIELQVAPVGGATIGFFWAPEGKGFNGGQTNERELKPSQKIGSYVFRVGDKQPLKQLRFDPLRSAGELEIETLTIYKLQDWQTESKDEESKDDQAAAEIAVPKLTPEEKKDRPNIVLILSDDQAWTDYGFMGHETIQTPSLDRLASESAVFRRGYVPTALCRPSLMTLITGHYAHTNRTCGNDPIPGAGGKGSADYSQRREELISNIDNFETLPNLLRERGYVSHQSGKWWEGNFKRGGFTHGMTRGFPQPGGRHGDDGLKIGRKGMEPVFSFIDHAVKQEQPFFVWYAPFLPHEPHNPPERILKKYLVDGRPEPIAKYYAMCEWFDETCGQLVNHLDEQGQRENTLVIYVCDNGWIQLPNKTAGGFADRSKQSPNEGGIRTPIMYRWPQTIKPADRSELCSSIDIVPTILAAAGARQPKNELGSLPGLDLLPALKNQTPIERDAIFSETFGHDIPDLKNPVAGLLYRSVIEGQWKLLLTYDGQQTGVKFPPTDFRPQLYDLIADPHEKYNLAGQHPELVARLAIRIADWWPVGERKSVTTWSEQPVQLPVSSRRSPANQR